MSRYSCGPELFFRNSGTLSEVHFSRFQLGTASDFPPIFRFKAGVSLLILWGAYLLNFFYLALIIEVYLTNFSFPPYSSHDGIQNCVQCNRFLPRWDKHQRCARHAGAPGSFPVRFAVIGLRAYGQNSRLGSSPTPSLPLNAGRLTHGDIHTECPRVACQIRY